MKKRMAQTHNETNEDCESDSSSEIPSEKETSEFSDSDERMEVDDAIAEAESELLKRPGQSSANEKSYAFDDSDDLDDAPSDSSSVRLIGSKLCIDGYIYVKSQSHNDSRITWECVRYTKQECPAKVVTSDPSFIGKLIVYRCPDMSEHNHYPSNHEVDEAEQVAKLEIKTRSEPQVVAQNLNGSNSESDQFFANQHSNLSEPEKIDGIHHAEQIRTDQLGSPALDTKKNLDTSTRMIGKRVCINGYMYVVKSSRNNSISWECRRSIISLGKCPATALTSNPSVSGKLIVRRGPEVSKHNHPPIPGDVEKSEELAKSGVGKEKIKVQAIVHTSNMNHGSMKARLPLSHKYTFKQSQLDRKRRKIAVTRQSTRPMIGRNLLSDRDIYRTFLTTFLKNPIFDRHNVVAALRSIYKTKNARIMAYGNILENREKIEKDLEALKKDPNTSITALNDGGSLRTYKDKALKEIDIKEKGTIAIAIVLGSNSSCSEQSKIVPEENRSSEKEQSTLSKVDEKAASAENSELSGKIPLQEEPPSTEQRVEGASEPTLPHLRPSSTENQLISNSSKPATNSNKKLEANRGIEEDLSSQKKTNDGSVSEIIPPVPAAVPIKNLLSVTHPRLPMSNDDLSGHESEVKQEIPCIDLTDDPDVKQECSSDKPQMQQAVDHGNIPTSHCITSTNSTIETNKTQTPDLPYQSPLCGGNPVITLNPQIQPQNQYNMMSSNYQGVWYDPNTHQMFSWVPANPNFNMPYMIPHPLNVSSVSNMATLNTNQLYAPIPLFRQPAMYQQFQGSKS